MVNHVRGEVPLSIEGRSYRLCLTLGALAEIEAGLGAEDLSDLERILARPRLSHLMVLLAALLRGGGHHIEERELAALQIDLALLGDAIAAAFAAAGLGAQGEQPQGEALAPRNLPPQAKANSGGAGSPSVSASWEWTPIVFGD